VPERARERVDVEGVDEDSRLWRNELRRAADPCRHYRAPARHRLEQRLAERLDEARLRRDPAFRGEGGGAGGVDSPAHAGTLAALESRPERAVACEGERPFVEPRKGVGEPDDVLALVESTDAEEAGRTGRRFAQREALAVDAARDDLNLPARLEQLRLE